MNINRFKYFFGFLVFCALCGCTTPPEINYRQALNMTEDTKLYTTYNIWCENPECIPSINYHKGNILPFGSEISIVAVDPEYITFKTVEDGKIYRLYHPRKWRDKDSTMEDFLKSIFTTKNADEQSKGIDSETLKKIRAGIVDIGMTKDEVLKACGCPPRYRTPEQYGTCWIYAIDPKKSLRVIFKNDKVNYIME